MNNIFYGLQLKLSLTNIKVEQPYNGETFSTHAHSAHVTFLHTSFVLCSLFRTSRLFQSHYIPFITPFHFQNLADRFQCTLCTIIRLVFKTAFDYLMANWMQHVFFLFPFSPPAGLNLLQPLRPDDADVALMMYDMAGFSPRAMQLLADQCRPWETQNTLRAWR